MDAPHPPATRGRLITHELISCVLFVPLVTATCFALLGLASWARWVGAREWRRARRAGADLPPEMPRRGVRPTILLGTILTGHLASFIVVAGVGLTGFGLLVAPLLTPWIGNLPVHAVEEWRLTVGQSWLLVPVGLGLLAASVVGAVGLARVRFRVMADLAEAEEGELEQQVRQLNASRVTLVDAFEAERRRIERDLHDGAQQRLVALALSLGMATHQARALGATDERARSLTATLAAAQDEVEAALRDLRTTVRGIHPQVLTDHGLFAAVRELAGRPGLEVEVSTAGNDHAVSGPVAAAAYFVVLEALANAGKHAGVDRASVTVRVDDRVRVAVSDAGRGGATLTDATATGLRGLAERVGTLGGQFEVHSAAGEGTTVAAALPLVPTWHVEP